MLVLSNCTGPSYFGIANGSNSCPNPNRSMPNPAFGKFTMKPMRGPYPAPLCPSVISSYPDGFRQIGFERLKYPAPTEKAVLT
ncbi:MAG: hypothetical protein FIB01_07595 [Gemmatimonadetes bacterium]|nr:hypothetical protein [Gemmatimonadota bacterium]